MCENSIETFNHFIGCSGNGLDIKPDWKLINENYSEKQLQIDVFIQNRQKLKKQRNSTTRGWPDLHLRLHCSSYVELLGNI